MPAMEDSSFARTLTYIAEHNDQGALGLIVNRPIEMTLGSLFERIDISLDHREVIARQHVYFGGPVQTDRGFVLHRPPGNWHSTLEVNERIALTSSRDILQSISDSGRPDDIIITLGYAGWARGQLEQEISNNVWLTVPADIDILFDTPPEARLSAAMQILGIDFTSLSKFVGHA